MNKAVREMNSQITELTAKIPLLRTDTLLKWAETMKYIRELEGYKRWKEGHVSLPRVHNYEGV
ncbi:MAG: hypothetical protein GY771_08930 [bacterium]|nr:hypothetical protein [bacterium]